MKHEDFVLPQASVWVDEEKILEYCQQFDHDQEDDMPSRMLKDEQDCCDFLTGLKLMGTGGGGSDEMSMEMLS